MKKVSTKSKIYLSLQIIFLVLTFVGFTLLLIGKLDNTGMSICCIAISLTFGAFYRNSAKDKD